MFIRPRPKLNLVPNEMYLKETGKGKGKGFFQRAQKKKWQQRYAEEKEKEKEAASCEESGESIFLDQGFRGITDEEEDEEVWRHQMRLFRLHF